MTDLTTTINFTYPQNLPLDDKSIRKFDYVRWLNDDSPMYLKPQTVKVKDLSPELENLYNVNALQQLDDRGFAVVNSPPKSSLDPLDEQSCINEVRDLLKSSLSAKEVIVWNIQHRDGHNHCDNKDGKDAAPTDPVPAYRAHVDQDAKRAYEHIEREVGRSVLEDNNNRIQIINAWLPCIEHVVDSPLTVCDFKTVSEEDLGHTTDYFGEHYSILYNPNQQWYYIRDQGPHQVYFLRCFDSLDGKDGISRFTPHTAIQDRTRLCNQSRKSVELRCIVIS